MMNALRLFFLKRIFLFLVSSILFFPVSAQDSIAAYYTKNWVETEIKDSATYFRVGKREKANDWNGVVKDYFMSGKPQMVLAYLNGERHGWGKFYYENGQIEREGEYVKGNKAGVWVYYYENGKLKMQGSYVEGSKKGVWMYYYSNGIQGKEILHIPKTDGHDEEKLVTCYDSLGEITLKDGNGTYTWYNEEEDFYEAGGYKNGLKEGTWIGKAKKVKSNYIEWYEAGKLVKGTNTYEGREYNYTETQKQAQFKGGFEELYKYLQKTIEYPDEAVDNNIQGKVYVEFVVATDGSIVNIGLKRSVSQSLDVEALRVVGFMPNWEPAQIRGRPVRSKFVLPINFKTSGRKKSRSDKKK